jgi:hypothetical protein
VSDAVRSVAILTLFTAIKEMLGNVEKGLVAKVLAEYYDNDESKVPEEAYLNKQHLKALQNGFQSEDNDYGLKYSSKEGDNQTTIHTYEISKSLPPDGAWIQHLAGPKSGWLRAFLTSVSIVQGSGITPNQAANVFKPRQNQKVKIVTDAAGNPLKVDVYGGIRQPKLA